MQSLLPTLPLTLRSEAFGGLVFDPATGTLLHLDEEGFRVARLLLEGKRTFLDPAKRRLASELAAEIPLNASRTHRFIDLPPLDDPRGMPPALRAPTLLDFQITNRCNMGCPHCYASSRPDGDHVPWKDLETVVARAQKAGVCQIALGGGEPLLHPDITDLLHLCCERGLVPNLATGGLDFTDENLRALGECCGAVGLSLEGVGESYDRFRGRLGFNGFLAALARIKEAGIRTVLQIVLSERTLAELPKLVDFCLSQAPLYGVIFLAYKPVGRGEQFDRPLSALPPAHVSRELARAFQHLSPHMRVGYDCCMTPAIAGVEKTVFADISHIEGCSGLRGSCGVLPDLDVIPCTFTPHLVAGNLRDQSLTEIMAGGTATAFRDRISRQVRDNPGCAACARHENCWGGCPVFDLTTCA